MDQGITVQQIQPFQFVDTIQVSADHVLEWFILFLLVAYTLKTRLWSTRSRIPFLLTCSSSRKRPTFAVRFLAENLIFLITFTSLGAWFSLILHFHMGILWWIPFTQWVKNRVWIQAPILLTKSQKTAFFLRKWPENSSKVLFLLRNDGFSLRKPSSYWVHDVESGC